MTQEPRLSEEIIAYYNEGREVDRLQKGIGLLEQGRTQELLARYLPPPPAAVLDVGGGPGAYSLWLARAGYEVHLVDAMPLHIEQARAASAEQPAHPITTMQVGDARQLPFPDESGDAAILHGPLYHLTEREDRLTAIREAKRVLRPGGLILVVGITRYASTLVGLTRWWLEDPDYMIMIRRELAHGQHRPPKSWPGLFTTAYFHHHTELGIELEDAGLVHRETVAIQGPGWIVPDLEARWADPQQRELLLQVVRWTEKESVALDMSPHLLAVGEKRGGESG
jgi:ubiquinone/menaquinone biosynthesis C-methylase UbiE